MSLLPLPVVHRHIADVPGGAQHQPQHIGEAVLIAQHFLNDKALGGKVTGEGKLFGLAQHDLRHLAVEPAAEIAEKRMLLVMAVGGIGHVVALLQLGKQLAHLVGGGLAVVIQADHIVPPGVAQAGHNGCVLAKIFRQIHGADAPILPGQTLQNGKGAVGGAVVHQHDLVVILGKPRHSAVDFLHNPGDGMLRAVAGDHKRNKFHSPGTSVNSNRNPHTAGSPSSPPWWRRRG